MNNSQWSDEDTTSDYGGSLEQSEFTSINTSHMIHRYKNGRRYQNLVEGRYGLPNDDTEQAREGLKHRLYSDYILDGNFFISPIGDYPQKIVDLGTGAGFWPLDVGESFPSARVIGTDISAIQPPWMPPNVEFRVEDIDSDCAWTRIYADSDLIHFRSVIQTMHDPYRFLDRVYENLKPGGWVECHEIVPPLTFEDGTLAMDHPLQRLYDLTHNGPFSKKYNWRIYFNNELPQALRNAGFINVQEKHTHVPIGRWPREPKLRAMGMFNQTVIIDWAAAMLVKHDDLGITEDEASEMCRQLLDDMDNPRIHARLDWGIIWAQKPLS